MKNGQTLLINPNHRSSNTYASLAKGLGSHPGCDNGYASLMCSTQNETQVSCFSSPKVIGVPEVCTLKVESEERSIKEKMN